MPEVPANVAIAGEPTGLGAQVLADETAALGQAVPEIESKQDVPEPSKSDDEKQKDDGKADEPEAQKSETTKDDKPKEDKDKKPEETKSATVKIGKQEFASVEDAVREATRIMGRNAELSGQLKQANARAEEATQALESVKAQLDEALKVNQQWAEWYEKATAGETAEPPHAKQPSIDEVVRKVLAEQEAARAEAERMKAIEAEFEKVQNAPNYPQVAETIYKIADQINPLTGKYFTPKEAYEFACRMAGIVPELETTAPPPVPPKSPVNSAVKSSAARPSGSGRLAPQQETRVTTIEDEYLAKAFPL